MVSMIWLKGCGAPVPGNNPIRRWNAKIRNLRKYLRGWSRQPTGILKKEKVRLCTIIDELDRAAETRVLTQQKIELKSQSNAEVARMLWEEELRWYQRSKSNFILKGDANTKYFQNVSNGRHRKKSIHSLNQDEGMIEGQEQLKAYITSYYKRLFGAPAEDIFSMDETQTEDITHVSNEENTFLNSPFT